MEFNKVIQSRRSIRKYLDKEVTSSTIDELLKAASYAPSWKNSQTTRYHIIKNKELIEEFVRECLSGRNQENVKNASLLIVSTFVKDISGFKDGVADNELANGWGIYDCALSNQNLILEATNLNLGTLIMGIRDASKIRNLLGIPEQETIVSVISVGYFENCGKMPKRKEIKEIGKLY